MDIMTAHLHILQKKFENNSKNDFAKQHRKRCAPKKLDKNPENICTFDLFIFYRKEFRVVFDVPT